jgi:hypothetical protein
LKYNYGNIGYIVQDYLTLFAYHLNLTNSIESICCIFEMFFLAGLY